MTGIPPNDGGSLPTTSVSRLRTDELLDSFGKVAPKLKELVRCEFSTSEIAGCDPPEMAEAFVC